MLSGRHEEAKRLGGKDGTTDPGPSDLTCQDPGMRMSEARWNPLVCEHHALAFATSQETFFFVCSVSKPVTLEETMLPIQLS